MRRPNVNFSKWFIGCLVAMFAFTQGSVKADTDAPGDAMRSGIREIARQIKELLEKKQVKIVAVGAFSGSVGRDGNVGPEIQRQLSIELRAIGFTLDAKNPQAEIKGDYDKIDASLADEHFGRTLTGVLLGARIKLADGMTLGAKTFIFGRESVPRMLGLHVSLPPGADAAGVSEIFKKSLMDRQPPEIMDAVVRNRTASPYGIEILVGKDGAMIPRAPRAVRASAEIPMKKEDIYQIRLINDSDFDAAVTVSIDGISTFAFGDKAHQYWIVSPHSSRTIMGWYKNERQVLEFRHDTLPGEPEWQLLIKRDTGTICAAFSAAWTDDSKRPRDEVHGRRGSVDTSLDVRRNIGDVREVLIVGYELE